MRPWHAMRAALAALAAFAGTAACAEWEMIAAGNNTMLFVDPMSIRGDGNLRRVSTMISYDERQALGELSWVSLQEYDCREARLRTLAVTYYSERKAQGTVLKRFSVDTPGPWDDVPRNSALADILKIVCGR